MFHISVVSAADTWHTRWHVSWLLSTMLYISIYLYIWFHFWSTCLLNVSQSTLKLCHQARRTTVWPVSICYPLWKRQYPRKTRRYACEIDCSVFSEIESLCKARQAPLGQIRPSGRHMPLCHTHKSSSHNKGTDIQRISHCHRKYKIGWYQALFVRPGQECSLCLCVRTKEGEEGRKNWSF